MGVTHPILQIAIDDPSMDGLNDILPALAASPADLIEIGTPLLTTHGLRVVETFFRFLPAERIYVDIKCIDLWRNQLTPYLEAGILHLSIHALLELTQAQELIEYATRFEATLYVSSLGVTTRNRKRTNPQSAHRQTQIK